MSFAEQYLEKKLPNLSVIFSIKIQSCYTSNYMYDKTCMTTLSISTKIKGFFSYNVQIRFNKKLNFLIITQSCLVSLRKIEVVKCWSLTLLHNVTQSFEGIIGETEIA